MPCNYYSAHPHHPPLPSCPVACGVCDPTPQDDGGGGDDPDDVKVNMQLTTLISGIVNFLGFISIGAAWTVSYPGASTHKAASFVSALLGLAQSGTYAYFAGDIVRKYMIFEGFGHPNDSRLPPAWFIATCANAILAVSFLFRLFTILGANLPTVDAVVYAVVRMCTRSPRAASESNAASDHEDAETGGLGGGGNGGPATFTLENDPNGPLYNVRHCKGRVKELLTPAKLDWVDIGPDQTMMVVDSDGGGGGGGGGGGSSTTLGSPADQQGQGDEKEDEGKTQAERLEEEEQTKDEEEAKAMKYV